MGGLSIASISGINLKSLVGIKSCRPGMQFLCTLQRASLQNAAVCQQMCSHFCCFTCHFSGFTCILTSSAMSPCFLPHRHSFSTPPSSLPSRGPFDFLQGHLSLSTQFMNFICFHVLHLCPLATFCGHFSCLEKKCFDIYCK